MKTTWFKSALIFLCLNVGITSKTAMLYAQDVIVTVRGLQETKSVLLDSIIIYNETNKSMLKLGQLPVSSTDYKVNLSKGKLETGTTGIINAEGSAAFEISNSPDGFMLKTRLTGSEKINVAVYTVNGKLVQQKNFIGYAGENTQTFNLPVNQVYLVNVQSNSVSTNFKVLVSGNNYSEVNQISAIGGNDFHLKSVNNEMFSFTPGDRIQVTLKKGVVQSRNWLGKPVSGSLILAALPRTSTVFDMKQTLSSGAQINTISFSGVAFYSGCFYASSFYPPGKVADYFGFQYMRDNDLDESGHNTDFLTKAAYHTMHILDAAQMQKLIDLATEQEQLFNDYALKRLILINAFHRYLENKMPTGTTQLNMDEVKRISKELYLIDAEISYGRAIKFASIINSLTETQRDTLYKLNVLGMKTWVMPEKPTVSIPKGLNTWVMSNASELFSWFLGSVVADTYFCPERQGTYFGGFYMKDAPAVNNPGYAIDPEATAQKGEFMLTSILTTTESTEIKNIYNTVKPSLLNMVTVREKISIELRKAIAGQTVDKNSILEWSALYGEYDGVYIGTMAEQFVKVGRNLTTEQKNKLTTLRDLADFPCKDGKVFLYSSEIDLPTIPNTDFLFK